VIKLGTLLLALHRTLRLSRTLRPALRAAVPILAATVIGCGGGGDSSGRITVDVLVAKGTISNIFVGGTDIFGTTITGDGSPYLGAAYLIGSCSTVDDGNNVTTRTFDVPEALPVAGSVSWSGTLTTINGSNSCAGPDYTWVLSRPDATTLRSTVDVYNVRSTLRSLSLPSDFFKDPGNRFEYGRPGFAKTIDGCQTQNVSSTGLLFQELSPTCHNGAGIFVGFAIQSPPLGIAEWRSDRFGIGVRRTILGGNYRHVIAFNAPGADNLQPSWDSGGGTIRPGMTLHGEEEWTVFRY
jgi:hypothetical protein